VIVTLLLRLNPLFAKLRVYTTGVLFAMNVVIEPVLIIQRSVVVEPVTPPPGHPSHPSRSHCEDPHPAPFAVAES